ncbi:MAG: CRISPR-associated endonuclease Cas2 [Patescibacteria group bacterium]|mgnify:CR=1 FL=1
MGMIEQGARRERRWGAFKQAVLYAALGGAMIAIGAVPNFSKLIKYYAGAKKGARFNYQAKTTLGRLAANGLITFEEHDGRRYARITERGRRLLELETQKAVIAKKRKWDKHWRVIVFDIPEMRKSVRNRLRRFMDTYGFVRLQDSVWVYPHDCEDLIALAKAEFRIGYDVLYMIVERIEHDKHLREHFGLPAK